MHARNKQSVSPYIYAGIGGTENDNWICGHFLLSASQNKHKNSTIPWRRFGPSSVLERSKPGATQQLGCQLLALRFHQPHEVGARREQIRRCKQNKARNVRAASFYASAELQRRISVQADAFKKKMQKSTRQLARQHKNKLPLPSVTPAACEFRVSTHTDAITRFFECRCHFRSRLSRFWCCWGFF